jgi:hypothetical protein
MLDCERWTLTHSSVSGVLLGLGLGSAVELLLALGLGEVLLGVGVAAM